MLTSQPQIVKVVYDRASKQKTFINNKTKVSETISSHIFEVFYYFHGIRCIHNSENNTIRISIIINSNFQNKWAIQSRTSNNKIKRNVLILRPSRSQHTIVVYNSDWTLSGGMFSPKCFNAARARLRARYMHTHKHMFQLYISSLRCLFPFIF